MLEQKLQTDQIVALKAKDQVRLDTIRYIVSQIKNKEINTQKELTDEEVVSILQKVKKELHESIDSFTKGGRMNLVSEYQKQLDVLLAYLPPEMSDQDLELAVKELVEKNKELFASKPQALIGICVKELKAKADPARIMQALRKMSPGQSPA
ncbi:GatB/YqeY domain-containing protein [Candidatus Roizmanbacteria bacterium]|nr:GatB/YqeY domain-containing protein [Candidatus Roizmanbacteria bacterium]